MVKMSVMEFNGGAEGTGAEVMLKEHRNETQKLSHTLEMEKTRQQQGLVERLNQRRLAGGVSGGRSLSNPDLSEGRRPGSTSSTGAMYEVDCPKCGTRVQTPIPQEPDLPIITQTPDGIKIIGKNGKAINIHINVAGRKGDKGGRPTPQAPPAQQKLASRKQTYTQIPPSNQPTILPPIVPPANNGRTTSTSKRPHSGSSSGGSSMGRSPQQHAPPPTLPSQESGTDEEKLCIFCGREDPSFTPASLEEHYWADCPMLTKCEHCDKVVEISDLQKHLLTACVQKSGYRQCDRCKVALSGAEYTAHKQLLTCPEIRPNSAKQVCPLCRKMVARGEAGWKAHILESSGCSSNPRSNLNATI